MIFQQLVEWIYLNTGIPHSTAAALALLCMTIALYHAFFWISVCRVKLFHAKETCQIMYTSKDTNESQSISLEQLLHEKCPLLTDPKQNSYFVHPLLWSSHIHTIWCSLFGVYYYKRKVEYIRELIDTPDGGIISIDWTCEPGDGKDGKKQPYVLICHGLAGGSEESYIQELIVEIFKHGYQAVVMNFRGCSNTPLKTAKLYSGSSIDDVDLVVNHILKKVPNCILFGVGFSLGSNVMLKYAGHLGKLCPLVGVVSIGNPYDVLGSFRALDRTLIGKHLYSGQMGKNFKKVFMKHKKAFENVDWIDFEKMQKVSSILEFDAVATAKSFGYKTVHEYYRFCSCAFDIPYIEVPALLLTAIDDPVVTSECIPYYEIQSNPHVVLATTFYGGHLGWFTGETLIPTQRWFPKPVSQFIDAIFQANLSVKDIQEKPKPLEHTGTPWYSLPARVKDDRNQLIRSSSIQKCQSCSSLNTQNNQLQIIKRLPIQLLPQQALLELIHRALVLKWLVPAGLIGILQLYKFRVSPKNAVFFVLGYILERLRQ